MSWFDEGGSAHEVDAAKVMDSDAGELVWRIVQAGALVSIGLTSDGGALGVTITLDGRWRREYFRDSPELTEWLSEAVPAIEDEAARLAASPGRRKRSRGRSAP